MKESRRRIESMKLPCLMFTLDELLLLKKSLARLKQLLATKQEHHANVEFAHETIMHLQRKLYQIMGSKEKTQCIELCWKLAPIAILGSW